MSNSNFPGFTPLTTEEWENIIKEELGDNQALQHLSRQSPEGITVSPFYHFDTHKPLPFRVPNPKWDIAERITVDQGQDPPSVKKLQDLGIDRILLKINASTYDLEKLHSGFSAAGMPLHLEASEFNMADITEFAQHLPPKNNVHLQCDIIGRLTATGNWLSDEKADWDGLDLLLRKSTSATTLSVNAGLYQNAGANRVQQLAYAVAHANEYLNFITGMGLPERASKIVFRIAVDSNYFFEIAKIKALRWLWKSLCKGYNLPGDCLILAEPSRRNKTFLDYNINMVRSTTEYMSAILGGADTVCSQPYNEVFQPKDEFGARIARNQLLILRNESYFDRVSNPGEGAYYIEFLTRELAEAALEYLKKIEAEGGFIAGLKSGKIQNAIRKSAVEEEVNIREGKQSLMGVTNTSGQWELPPTIDRTLIMPPEIPGQTDIDPIIPGRLAFGEEQKALDNG